MNFIIKNEEIPLIINVFNGYDNFYYVIKKNGTSYKFESFNEILISDTDLVNDVIKNDNNIKVENTNDEYTIYIHHMMFLKNIKTLKCFLNIKLENILNDSYNNNITLMFAPIFDNNQNLKLKNTEPIIYKRFNIFEQNISVSTYIKLINKNLYKYIDMIGNIFVEGNIL